MESGKNSISPNNIHSISASVENKNPKQLVVDSNYKNLKWYHRGEQRRIIKNVVIISFAFEFLFTTYLGMSNLQSSINSEGGLGVYAMSLTHVFVVISAVFLPTFVIQTFTVKYTIIYTILGYTTFLFAQFYPTFWTLIPAAVVVGICAAPLWASKCTYITHVGHLYADIMGQSAEGVVVRFFGIFFLSFQSSLIWGNLISSLVLSSSSPGHGNLELNQTTTVILNETKNTSMCGAAFCPSFATRDEGISRPPDSQIFTLATIYLVLNFVAAALVALFLDPLSTFCDTTKTQVKTTNETIVATIRQMGTLRQLLIIPLTLWSGVNLGFYFADFSQAFVGCALGVQSIGYIGMAFGVTDALSAIGSGILVRYFGRLPVFTFGALLNMTILILLFNWKLMSKDYIFLILISGTWGMADSIWQTQINGLYGLLFKDNAEAAFSNYRLWESTGFIIGFVNNNLLCVQVKLYILLGFLSIGMCGYYIVEYLERSRKGDKTKM